AIRFPGHRRGTGARSDLPDNSASKRKGTWSWIIDVREFMLTTPRREAHESDDLALWVPSGRVSGTPGALRVSPAIGCLRCINGVKLPRQAVDNRSLQQGTTTITFASEAT